MVSFESDYITGTHPKILEKLVETNLEPLSGYGEDKYSLKAKEKIKKACNRNNIDIEFLVGGTQTNLIVISSLLNEFEGVIAANTGHIATHEAGAIENTGHKVLEIPSEKGKISAKDLNNYLEDFFSDENREHMVIPGMIYLSFPTEYGTLYSKDELTEISNVAKKYHLKLFIDGARLGYGLKSYENDLSLEDLCNLTDVFYIGATKVGGLCGEAVIFTNNSKPKHFTNLKKKRGGLLAKGRLLGIIFDTLFTNDLYFRISRHAIDMAKDLKKILVNNKIKLYLDSPTNQQFAIISKDLLKELEREVKTSFWENYDKDNVVIRLATCWSTTKEDLNNLDKALKSLNR